MPELPEVETIKNGLQRKIVGLTFKNITVLNPKTFQGNPQEIVGRKIVDIWRRAKMLGISLDNDEALLFHLKMSGQLIWVGEQNSKSKTPGQEERVVGGHPTEDMLDKLPNNSTRVVFEFDDDSKLYFNDQRKFGWIKQIKDSQSSLESIFQSLGPEPLGEDFDWKAFKQRLMLKKNTPVKIVVMDQQVLSGVGNIYAAEGLFLAGIDPRRKVSSLSDSDFAALFEGIRKSLLLSIEYGGSTKTHFVSAEGVKGRFLDFAYVYNRQGEPCKKCQGVIDKVTLGGRGTYYCPHCQK